MPIFLIEIGWGAGYDSWRLRVVSSSRRDLKELIVSVSRVCVVGLCLIVAPACSGTDSPLSPAAGTSAGGKLTAPTADSPAEAAQLSTLRPTLVVKNGTSDESGAKVYEFQISDKSDFSAGASNKFAAFTVLAHATNVPEGSGGTRPILPTSISSPQRACTGARGCCRTGWRPTGPRPEA